jgi:hypothetical protein
VVALDVAGLLERAHAPQARRCGDLDALGQLDIRHPAICLQFNENLTIYGVELLPRHEGTPSSFLTGGTFSAQ